MDSVIPPYTVECIKNHWKKHRGIWADASVRHVNVRFRTVVFVRYTDTSINIEWEFIKRKKGGSQALEEYVIRWAKSSYPNDLVYNDNKSACEKFGAIWIPRKENVICDKLCQILRRRFGGQSQLGKTGNLSIPLDLNLPLQLIGNCP